MKTNFKKFGLQIGALALAFGIFASASPQALAASSISSSKAKSIALSNAKLKSSQVTFTKVKSDRENGVAVWDVEFKTSTKKYEYEIRKSNGKILDKDVENIKSKKKTPVVKAASKSISSSKAKSIALSNAKLKASQVTFTKVKSDREDGVNVWDVEFKTSTKKYEYEIRKSDGRILDKDVETIRSKKQTSSKKSTSTSSNITRAKAKSIALAHAGVSASKIRDYDIELDTYRGTKVYEIDFESGRYEYEYKINAQTGKIVFVEKDRD